MRTHRGHDQEPGRLLAAALAYAAAGWPVFPCRPDAKIPATGHGCKDATTSPAAIHAWWRRAACNVAIATGAPGPDVLDVDVHATGSGWTGYERLKSAGMITGAQRMVRTRSGDCTSTSPGRRSETVPCPELTWTSGPAADTSSHPPRPLREHPTNCCSPEMTGTRRSTGTPPSSYWHRLPAGAIAVVAAAPPAWSRSCPGWKRESVTAACSGRLAVPWTKATPEHSMTSLPPPFGQGSARPKPPVPSLVPGGGQVVTTASGRAHRLPDPWPGRV
jgi:hypothetical protein